LKRFGLFVLLNIIFFHLYIFIIFFGYIQRNIRSLSFLCFNIILYLTNFLKIYFRNLILTFYNLVLYFYTLFLFILYKLLFLFLLGMENLIHRPIWNDVPPLLLLFFVILKIIWTCLTQLIFAYIFITGMFLVQLHIPLKIKLFIFFLLQIITGTQPTRFMFPLINQLHNIVF
jgi:hypothetical protein